MGLVLVVIMSVMLNTIAVVCNMWQYSVMLILLKCEHVCNDDIACPSVNDAEMSPNPSATLLCLCSL